METKTLDAMNIIDNAMKHSARLISQPDSKSNYVELNSLCISLYRGIDDALANGETHPPKGIERLPMLIRKMNLKRKSDDEQLSLPWAMMVLLISVKYACEFGWFQKNESEELLTVAHKIGKIYNTLGNVSSYEPNSSCHSSVVLLLPIMGRFFPNMNLGRIIASVEARPGHGASVVDFLITKNNNVQSYDKTICLLVARTDDISTPACLISPQQVDFLLNGKAIDKRIMLQMDDGPQMPTCVNSMLKFGLNLLQAVGQFDGHYIILVAYMNYVVASLSDQHPLPEYVQPNNKVHNCEKELQESGCSLDTISNVADLINKDNDLDIIMDTTETADRNPFQAAAVDFPVLAATHNRVPTIINMSATSQNRAPSQFQYPYISGMLNELSNSHLQQRGSQANAHGAAPNSQQARVMASSPVSRTNELRPPTSRMRGSLSGQQSYFGTHVSLPNPVSTIMNDTQKDYFSLDPR